MTNTPDQDAEMARFEKWWEAASGNLMAPIIKPIAKDAYVLGLAARNEWQPIETAPKDGRTLLLGKRNELGNWRTMRGQWFTQERINEEWEEPDDAEAGWYETAVEPDYPPNCWGTNPTHWMPLPQPPKE